MILSDFLGEFLATDRLLRGDRGTPFSVRNFRYSLRENLVCGNLIRENCLRIPRLPIRDFDLGINCEAPLIVYFASRLKF